VRSLAVPASLASAVSTLDVQLQILSASSCATDIHNDSYTTHGSPSPVDPLPHKQSFWDKPDILTSQAVVESSISDPHQMARFLPLLLTVRLALALPVSSCGLRLTDEAV